MVLPIQIAWWQLLVFQVCLLLHPFSAQAAGDKLVLASVPWGKDSEVRARYAPLADLLSRKLGREVEIHTANKYEEVGERLHHKAADLGILGPKSYVETREKYPETQYLATCKQPEASYHSLIIARKSSLLGTLADLGGKSFAYTETGSTSGYLYPRQMIRQAGYDPDTLFSTANFLNKHDKVYDAVARGAVDAGAVSSTDMAEAVSRNGDVYRILKQSTPIPRNAIVAGAHLPPALVQDILAILRDAEHDQAFLASDSILKGFHLANDSLYDIIRQEIDLH